MKYLRAFFIAAAMYSRLPVPNVRWDEESKEAVLFLFPLLGVIEAGLIFLLAGLLLRVSAGAPLSAFCLTAAPLLFTGGIHFDGFLDTADALGSWKGKEEKRSGLTGRTHTARRFCGLAQPLGIGEYAGTSAAAFTDFPHEPCAQRALDLPAPERKGSRNGL